MKTVLALLSFAIPLLSIAEEPRTEAMTVELVYLEGCPNYPKAKAELEAALAELSIEAKVVLLNRDGKGIPDHALLYGSPSILLNGSDLFGAKPSAYPSCRLYGRKGYPSKTEIIGKLESNESGKS